MAPAGFGGRVEGVHAVKAALSAGRVTRLYVERGRRDVEAFVEQARRTGAQARLVNTVRGLAETDSPQGLVAKARPIPLRPLQQLLSARADRVPPALLVLDHLQDPRNVGAMARTALAAGMTGMVVPRRRAAPLSALALKAAAGSLERLPVASVSSVATVARQVADAGLWTVGLDPSAGQLLFGLTLLAEPVAVFVGAEGRGLGRLVGKRLDALVSIPMATDAAGLNAAVAAALACYELARVRKQAGP